MDENDLFSFECTGCGATLSVRAVEGPLTGPCPYCATVITSPAVAPAPSPLSAPKGPGLRIGKDALPAVYPGPEVRPGVEVIGTAGRRKPLSAVTCVGLLVLGAGGAVAWRHWQESTATTKPDTAVLTAPKAPDIPASQPPAPTPEVRAEPPAPALIKPALPEPAPPAVEIVTVPEAAPPPPGIPPTATTPEPVPAPPEVAAPAPPAPVSDRAVMAAIDQAVPAFASMPKPRAALVKFLAAASWQERIKHCLAPDKIRADMERYYQQNPDGAIVPGSVEFTKALPTEADPDRYYYAFLVILPDNVSGIPISVEDTRAGCFVEWRSFAETKDRLLEKFCEQFRSEPGEFRVLITRAHYFGKELPGQDAKESYMVQTSDGSFSTTVWAVKNSHVYSKYLGAGERAKWDTASLMVVRLEWVREDATEYIRVRDVVAESWHPDAMPPAR